MDTTIKVWLIIAAALVILGALVFTVIMSINHWDFYKLSTTSYITGTHSITEDFTELSLEVDSAKINFIPSEDELCEVVCFEDENTPHSVTVEDGCLTIRVNDQRKWYHHIGIFNGTSKITVTLPRGVYQSLKIDSSTGNIHIPGDFSFQRIDIAGSTGDVKCSASASESLKIRVSTGNIRVENLSTGTLDLSVSTGHVDANSISCSGAVNIKTSTGKTSLKDLSCGSLTSTGSTGDLTLENVIAEQTISIKRNTGDVQFIKCDAAQITVTTSTGDVTGTLLSDKVFITKTATGRVTVPSTTSGGQCKVTTNTGDIKLTIEAE